MSKFISDHRVFSETMRINAAPEAIWPQLCPTREYDWIEHWRCELVRSRSGCNELGCVFRTHFPAEGEPETWLTTRFEPCRLLEFARVNADRAIRFVIELQPEGAGTRIAWTHDVTPLTERGNAMMPGLAETFPAKVRALETMLGHYLETGAMWRQEE